MAIIKKVSLQLEKDLKSDGHDCTKGLRPIHYFQ